MNDLNSYGPFKSSPSVYLYILRVFVKKIPQTLTRSVNLTHNWKLLCPGPVDPSPRRTHTFRAKGELFEEFYVLSLSLKLTSTICSIKFQTITWFTTFPTVPDVLQLHKLHQHLCSSRTLIWCTPGMASLIYFNLEIPRSAIWNALGGQVAHRSGPAPNRPEEVGVCVGAVHANGNHLKCVVSSREAWNGSGPAPAGSIFN